MLHRRNNINPTCRLVGHSINTSTSDVLPTTSYIKLERDGQMMEEVAIGSGPVDAAYKAINRMLGMDIKLESFSLSAVTDGEDAIGEAVVKVTDSSGESYTGTGLSTDILESSIRAYVNSINKIIEAGTAPDEN